MNVQIRHSVPMIRASAELAFDESAELLVGKIDAFCNRRIPLSVQKRPSNFLHLRNQSFLYEKEIDRKDDPKENIHDDPDKRARDRRDIRHDGTDTRIDAVQKLHGAYSVMVSMYPASAPPPSDRPRSHSLTVSR